MIEAAVIDACVAVKWVIQEAGSEEARRLFSARLEAPDLLLVECANILWKKASLRDIIGEQRRRGSRSSVAFSGDFLSVPGIG